MPQFRIKHPLLLITIFVSALLFLNLNNLQVPFSDELLFEEASFNAAQGKWLIPQLKDSPWIEKPPLYFWITAPLFHLAKPFLASNPLDLSTSLNSQGVFIYPWIRRFWSYIAAIVTVAVTGYLSKKIFPQTPSYLAPLILIASPAFIFTSQAASLDIPASGCISIAFISLLYLKKKPLSAPLVFIISTAAAIMFRSFLGLTPFILLFYQLLTRQISLKHCSLITLGILALILPWHLYAYLQYGQEFLSIYFGFNLIDHGISIPDGYTQNPPWYYASLLCLPPWLIIASIYPLYRVIKQPHHLPKLSSPLILVLIYFVAPFLILSASATRHPWYAAQLTVPLSLLCAFSFWKIYTRLSIESIKYLAQIFFITCLAAPISMILFSSDSSAPNIKALHFAITQSPNHYIYSYKNTYLPDDKLYHPYPVKVIHDDFLATNADPLIIYINQQDLDDPIFQNYILTHLGNFSPGSIYRIIPNPNNL